MKKISIATTAYNEAENLPELVGQLTETFRGLAYDYEIVIIDNGSSDGSWELLRQLKLKEPRIRAVRLLRNFKHQGGLIAALEHATGDAVITMDADLQHPAGTIPELLRRWEEGHRLIHTRRKTDGEPGLRRRVNDVFYFFISKLSGMNIPQGDFRLIDRSILKVFLTLPERDKFIRGLLQWIEPNGLTLDYSPAARFRGSSKYSLKDLFILALTGVTSFSTLPLRLLFVVGIVVMLPAFTYLVYVSAYYAMFHLGLVQGSLPSGWATLVVLVIFFGSVNLMAVGVLGEYLGKVFLETKHRPIYVPAEEL
jgi:dolichol-phosphate mannosyltransferase